MRKIDTPPSHPHRYPYVQIDNELCDWIRVPTIGEMHDALQLAEAFDGGAKVEVQMGATIRLGWRSHQFELEATEPRAVYRELHEHGCTVDEIATIAAAITDLFSKGVITEAEVQDEEDFTPATQQSA